MRYQRRRRGGWMFFIYLILALYFFNVPFQFIKTPAIILSIEKWIILVGGLFLLMGGINFIKTRRYGL